MTISIMEIGLAIRNIRKEKGVSQENLAYDCEISRSYMYKIEAGKCNPTLKVLEIIANRLDFKVWEIVKIAEEVSPSLAL